MAYFYVGSAKGVQFTMGRLKRPPERLQAPRSRLVAPMKAALPFYHSPEWLAKRRALIAARGAWCEVCGASGRLHLDHIVEVKDGGELLDDLNLQLLCQPCHNRKTARVKLSRSGA
jgi:5-methylcytosine-specific restriction endonuclease McrA